MQKIKFTFFTTSDLLPFDIEHTVEYERDSADPQNLMQIYGELANIYGQMSYSCHWQWKLLVDDVETPINFWVQKFNDVEYGPNRFAEERYFVSPVYFIKPFLPFTPAEINAVEFAHTNEHEMCAHDSAYPIIGILHDPKISLGNMWYNLKDYI